MMPKRMLWMIAALLVGGAALAFPWLRAASGDNLPPACMTPTACAPLCCPPMTGTTPAAPKDADEAYTRELLDIVEKTKSVDSLTACILLLAETKVDSRRLAPVLI